MHWDGPVLQRVPPEQLNVPDQDPDVRPSKSGPIHHLSEPGGQQYFIVKRLGVHPVLLPPEDVSGPTSPLCFDLHALVPTALQCVAYVQIYSL